MLDDGCDQAQGLRTVALPHRLGVMAFPLAAGPVRWIAQLVHALRALGRRPVVLDAHRGALTAAFGLRLRHELADLLAGARGFDSVAGVTADGVWVLRGERGLEAFADSGESPRRLLGGFERLHHGFDDLVLAMPAAELACLAAPADTVPVLGLGPDPAARVQAYGLAKDLRRAFGFERFACVVHGVRDAAHAHALYQSMETAGRRFLGVDVQLAGWLPAEAAPGAPAFTRTAQALLDIVSTPAPACRP